MSVQINLSDQMIFVVSKCLNWLPEDTLRAFKMAAGDYEVNGVDARDLFRQLEHDRFGTKYE